MPRGISKRQLDHSFLYGGNFRIFRIEEHHTKISLYNNVCSYNVRHYAELYEYENLNW